MRRVLIANIAVPVLSLIDLYFNAEEYIFGTEVGSIYYDSRINYIFLNLFWALVIVLFSYPNNWKFHAAGLLVSISFFMIGVLT